MDNGLSEWAVHAEEMFHSTLLLGYLGHTDPLFLNGLWKLAQAPRFVTGSTLIKYHPSCIIHVTGYCVLLLGSLWKATQLSQQG